ncbi:hypothetical protein WOLCODRAFT_142881 [Wolfiporia cocos MD-104 SS10]|uniref:Peptidase M20 dimerisation domain-containing protein n=1 Tax=Wolfiporia cocos (strain MD-104) TaxID=742152 RepID=A0A2H3JV55_WOLCO|nr:hypothetical protein WOLCODRAFT_142881 [Wolfiporia cocos MD-104 SS10]
MPPPTSCNEGDWAPFGELHRYFKARFSLVHENLEVQEINCALVYRRQGSDESLKPLPLTAHQCIKAIVYSCRLSPMTETRRTRRSSDRQFYCRPIDSATVLWVLRCADNKAGLIKPLEKLSEKGFEPTRSIVLARKLAVSTARAPRRFGTISCDNMKDMENIRLQWWWTKADEVIMSVSAVGEKGMFDARVEVTAPGGHLSFPPPHTSIAMLSNIFTELEANPPARRLDRRSSYYGQLQCQAAYDPTLPKGFKALIKASFINDEALVKLESVLSLSDPLCGPLAGTTQAIDAIRGGVKSNALPENVYMIMNHRIDIFSSVADVKSHIEDIARPVALDMFLYVEVFNDQDKNLAEDYSIGCLYMSNASDESLEPASITSTFGSGPYELLTGTIVGVLESPTRPDIPRKVHFQRTPTLLGLSLTKHIFRYGHINGDDYYNGAHAVNEAIKAVGFIEIIRFHTRLILNADESDFMD